MTNIINILLLEDDSSQITDFNRAKERLEKINSDYRFEIISYNRINNDLYADLLKNNYDFAIVDLKLNNSDGEGNEEFNGNKFVEHIYEKLNIPIVINTANAENLDERFSIEDNKNPLFLLVDHNELELEDGKSFPLYILEHIVDLYKAGITRVIGKHGKINQILNKLIWNGGLDNIKEWKKFNTLEKAEESLGRYVLSHIHHKLSGNYENFHPEEIYLKNMGSNKYVTGTILEKILENGKKEYYIILTPACDIANGRCDYFLVAKIDTENNLDEIINGLKNNILKLEKEDCDKNRKDKAKKAIENQLKNYKSNNSKREKLLPKSKLFDGGYIKFNELHKIENSEIRNYETICHISEHFLADIIADFGYYYSRQGQPNLDDNIIIQNLINNS